MSSVETSRVPGPGKKVVRNGSIDLFRILGALAIVYFHMRLPGKVYALAALPGFVILLVYLGGDRSVASRARRLLLPWVVWSGFFGAMFAVDSVMRGRPPLSFLEPWMLFTGTSLHLWFLPFCFLFLLLIRGLGGAAAPGTRLWPVLGVLALLSVWLDNTTVLPFPLKQWVTVVPAAAVGLAMVRSGRPVQVAMAGAALFLVQLLSPFSESAVQSLIATLAIALALMVVFESPRWLRVLGDAAFGLYLIHPFFIAVVSRAGHLPAPVEYLAVCALSMLAALALRRFLPSIV